MPKKEKPASEEPAMINLLDAFDVAFCMREFGVPEERLVDLIREHGNSVARIREAIGGDRAQPQRLAWHHRGDVTYLGADATARAPSNAT
jgi:hypothetical protein